MMKVLVLFSCMMATVLCSCNPFGSSSTIPEWEREDYVPFDISDEMIFGPITPSIPDVLIEKQGSPSYFLNQIEESRFRDKPKHGYCKQEYAESIYSYYDEDGNYASQPDKARLLKCQKAEIQLSRGQRYQGSEIRKTNYSELGQDPWSSYWQRTAESNEEKSLVYFTSEQIDYSENGIDYHSNDRHSVQISDESNQLEEAFINYNPEAESTLFSEFLYKIKKYYIANSTTSYQGGQIGTYAIQTTAEWEEGELEYTYSYKAYFKNDLPIFQESRLSKTGYKIDIREYKAATYTYEREPKTINIDSDFLTQSSESD